METPPHLIPPRAGWKVRGSVVGWRPDGSLWHTTRRREIVDRRHRGRAVRLQPPAASFLGESPTMTRRSLIAAWGLVLIRTLIPADARSQGLRAGYEVPRAGPAPSYEDWRGASGRAAVAAGG